MCRQKLTIDIYIYPWTVVPQGSLVTGIEKIKTRPVYPHIFQIKICRIHNSVDFTGVYSIYCIYAHDFDNSVVITGCKGAAC